MSDPAWQGAPMTFDALLAMVGRMGRPVILLEGTRDLPTGEGRGLSGLAAMLAARLPRAVFRSGNARGSDEAFADGVRSVDPSRLEIVVPAPGHRGSAMPRGAYATTITDVSESGMRQLADVTGRATPRHRWLARKFSLRETPLPPRPESIIRLIMRDTLKVVGDHGVGLAPATIGIFRENTADPDAGGTGHTIRCCRETGVPVVLRREWRAWGR